MRASGASFASKRAESGMRRSLARLAWITGAAAFTLLIFTLCLPLIASAQNDPGQGVSDGLFNGGGRLGANIFAPSSIQATAQGWVTNAQNLARHIFWNIFIFEVFIVGVQGILSKQEVEQFLAGFSFKVFTAGFFLWLISSAGTVFPAVLTSFSHLGKEVSGDNSKTLGEFFGGGTALALAYLAAADALTLATKTEVTVEGALIKTDDMIKPVLGENDAVVLGNDIMPSILPKLGIALNTLFGSTLIIFVLAGMGMMMLGCMAVVLMTWIVLVCEACIVMFAGIVLLGFASTRFTMPFTQGYLKYTITIGVKYFTFWLVIAIIAPLLKQIALESVAGLLASAVLKFVSLGGFITLIPLLYPAFEFAIVSALAFSIPSLAASFMSGTMAMSATQTMAGAMTSMQQASAMLGQMHKYQAMSEDLKNPPGKYLSNIPPPPAQMPSLTSNGSGETMNKPVFTIPTDQLTLPKTAQAGQNAEPEPLLYKAKPKKTNKSGPSHVEDHNDQPDINAADVYNPDIYSPSVFNAELNTVPGAPQLRPRRKEPSKEKGMGLESLSPESIGALSTKALFNYLINSNTKNLNAAQRRALQHAFKERAGLRKEYLKYLKKEAIDKTADQLINYSITAQALEKALLPTGEDGRVGGMKWGQAGENK